MKKELIIPSLGIVAAIFFSACSKNEVVSIADAPQKIAFSPLSGKLSTRALLDGATYNADFPSFGTFAYYLPADKNADGTVFNWNTNHTAATLYIPQSEVTNNGQSTGYAWTTATPYYWPKTGGITFFAYSPFSYQETAGGQLPVTLTGTGLLIGHPSPNYYDVAAHQDTDLLVADVQKDVHGNNVSADGYNGVPIIFRHKLSQIVNLSFSTIDKNGEAKDYANGHDGTENNEYKAGDVVFELVKVTLNSLATKGLYTYEAQTQIHEGWTIDSQSAKDYTWYDRTSGTAEQFGATPLSFDFNDKNTENPNDYLLVLPQPLQNTTEGQSSTTPRFKIQYRVKTYTSATEFSLETVDTTINLHALHGSSTESLEMNKKISYSFRVCLEDQQIYWAPSIVDWEPQDFIKQF